MNVIAGCPYARSCASSNDRNPLIIYHPCIAGVLQNISHDSSRLFPSNSFSLDTNLVDNLFRKKIEGGQTRNKKYVKMFVKRTGKEYLLIENNRDFGRIIYALPRWLVAGEQRLDAWWIFFGMTRPRMDSYLFDNRHKLFPSLLLV